MTNMLILVFIRVLILLLVLDEENSIPRTTMRRRTN